MTALSNKGPEQMVSATVFMFGIDRDALLSKSRVRHVAEARHALAWALRQNDWSLEEIGAFLNRDHTTIIHALKVVERRRQHDARFAERLTQITQPGKPPPVDWHARVAALEARVIRLEELLREATHG